MRRKSSLRWCASHRRPTFQTSALQIRQSEEFRKRFSSTGAPQQELPPVSAKSRRCRIPSGTNPNSQLQHNHYCARCSTTATPASRSTRSLQFTPSTQFPTYCVRSLHSNQPILEMSRKPNLKRVTSLFVAPPQIC